VDNMTELKDNQAAIVFDSDGSVDLIIPEMDDDMVVPKYIMTAVVMMTMVKNGTQLFRDAVQETLDTFNTGFIQ
jgi:exopolysaccharide biosynthesis protein